MGVTKEKINMLRDGWVTGYDMGYPGGDKTCIAVYRRPGRLRKLLRRIGLDKSKWELKLVRMEMR